MATLIVIAVVVVLIAGAVWTSRTPPSSGNGDNREAAGRYGTGYHP